MPRLFTRLGHRYCILYVWQMPASFRKKSTSEQRKIWCLVNSEFCDQEQSVSWSSTWTDWKTANLSRSPQDAQKGTQKEAQHHVRKIPERSSFSRVIDQHLMGWTHLHCIRRDRKRGPLLRCEEREKKPKRELVESHIETPRVQMDHWIREMTTKKQRRLATSCPRSMQQPQDVEIQHFILKNKFDKDPTNNSKGTKRIRIGFIQKLGPRVLLLHHPGGDRPTAGGQHGIGTLYHGMNSDFSCEIFAHREWRFPSNRREV